MDGIVTRLDPDFPLCWEDPYTLRFGFHRALARVSHPSVPTQRLIRALSSGVRRDLILKTALTLGATAGETRELLETLRPVLVDAPEDQAPIAHDGTTAPLRVWIGDEGRASAEIATAFVADGHELVGHRTDPTAHTDLAVLVERYLEPLERAQRWLAAGVPHLLLRFCDAAVTVGPLVSHEGSPCHSCISLDKLDDDPALPGLAAQLVGLIPQSESPAVVRIAAATATSFVHHWLAGAAQVHTAQLRVPVAHGLIAGTPRLQTAKPHPQCACTWTVSV